MASPFLLRRFLVGSSLAAAALVAACGSRGPLDIDVIQETPSDAATDAHGDASVEASSDASDGGADAIHDALEAAPDTSMGFDGGPLVNCGSCLVQTCGTQLLTCVTASGCLTALQCVASTCLTSGTPSITCLTGCTNGDSTTQQQLLSVLGCVIGNCPVCTSALAGLGGGLGGGGGGG
jgi:hypothetical protein